MWIRLLKKVDEHEAGTFLRVERSVGEAYIAAKFAEDGGNGPEDALVQTALQTFRSECAGMINDMAQAARDARAAAAADARPNIRVLTDEGDRSRGPGDFIKNVVQALGHPRAESRDKAHTRLLEVYGSAQVDMFGDGDSKRDLNEGTGTAFGYTTPTLYESQMLEEAAEQEVLLPHAFEVPMGAADVEWPALDQYRVPANGQSAFYGGVQVYRKGELIARQETDPKAAKVKLMANDLTALSSLSRNLMQDSLITVDAYVTKLIGGAIGWRADWESILGNGEGMMLGILNAAAAILYARQTGGTITFKDVTSMKARMLPQSKKRARWLIHPFSVAVLEQMTDTSGRLIYVPNFPGPDAGPAAANPPAKLLGIPVIESEKMPPPGTTGELVLVDPKAYLHGKRAGLEIGLSEHFLFNTDEIAIRAKLRNDGKPWLKKPIYLADGSQSNQVSSIVVLQ